MSLGFKDQLHAVAILNKKYLNHIFETHGKVAIS